MFLRRLKANGTMGGGSSASKAWKEAPEYETKNISNEKHSKRKTVHLESDLNSAIIQLYYKFQCTVGRQNWNEQLLNCTVSCICKSWKVCLINNGLFKILYDVVKKRERQLQLKIMQWWVNAGINTPVCSWPIACPNSTPSPPLHFHHNYHIFQYHITTTITFTFFYLEIVTHIWWKWY